MINQQSYLPCISSNGRFIAFSSSATNLVPLDNNGLASDIFVHDMQTGQTESISGNSYSSWSSISSDGRFVAFQSNASNLVSDDTNDKEDIFVWDRQTAEITRVSIDSSGNQGNNESVNPSISADGRFVTFESWASNLITDDTNNTDDIFIHDRQTGETKRVSVDSSGNQANNYSSVPSISSDGRYIVFESSGTNLVSGDTNEGQDIFVHDCQTGETKRVSIDSSGNQAISVFGLPNSEMSSISSDGRFVAFNSNASNLVSDDTNNQIDIFIHDCQIGQTIRVSINSSGNEANNYSSVPSISSDGRFVAFGSMASNLVDDDTNGAFDIFIRQFRP